MSYRRGGMYERTPSSRAPGKGRIFVGDLCIDAQCIVIVGPQQLAPLVEPAPLFAQSVHRFIGIQFQTDKPALFCTRYGRKTKFSDKVPISGRSLDTPGTLH